MDVVFDSDPAHFLSRAKPFLTGHPIGHSMLIVLLHFWMTGESPDMRRTGVCAHDADGAVVGVGVNVQGWRTVLSAMPETAVAAMETALAEVDPDVSLVSGPVGVVVPFVERRGSRVGRAFRPVRRLAPYVVEKDGPPPEVPGAPRSIDEGDLPLLTRWLGTFGGFSPESRARNLLDHGLGYLWEVDDEPVALSGITDHLLGIAHSGPIYTLPEHRGVRYAEAVWRVALEAARKRGTDTVVNWANLDYPPTGRLLARVGARMLGEEIHEYTLT